ncbi:hypothetical protein ACLOJK_039387 [Asimina triloba]
MASTSSAEVEIARIKKAASSFRFDNQYLIAEVRKGLTEIKQIAVGLEKGNHPELLTDFKKIFEDEVAKLRRDSHSVPQNNQFYRQFKEAIWKVHHAGQPMPGEELEDIVMTSTEINLLNITCPLSGKPVVELKDPVRSMDCKHIYEKAAVVHYMKSQKSNIRCPVAGCPKQLVAGRVVCDPLLEVEIDEMRANTHRGQATFVEDFTELNDDEN